jgi:hypothetical protein
MTSTRDDLFSVAQMLDETPVELLNGGAADALRALAATAAEAEEVARTRGIELDAVHELWARANACLQDVPQLDGLYPAAAEAAALLYTAAWVLDSPESATVADLRAVM